MDSCKWTESCNNCTIKNCTYYEVDLTSFCYKFINVNEVLDFGPIRLPEGCRHAIWSHNTSTSSDESRGIPTVGDSGSVWIPIAVTLAVINFVLLIGFVGYKTWKRFKQRRNGYQMRLRESRWNLRSGWVHSPHDETPPSATGTPRNPLESSFEMSTLERPLNPSRSRPNPNSSMRTTPVESVAIPPSSSSFFTNGAFESNSQDPAIIQPHQTEVQVHGNGIENASSIDNSNVVLVVPTRRSLEFFDCSDILPDDTNVDLEELVTDDEESNPCPPTTSRPRKKPKRFTPSDYK